METIINYFVQQEGRQWSPNFPNNVAIFLNELTNPERRALRSLLFNEAKKIQIKAKNFDALDWLEMCFSQIDRYTFRMHHAYFSPGFDILDNLRDLIDRARISLDLCVFSSTDERLVRAIKAALKRKVKIRIITDDLKTLDRGSKINWLDQMGIEVKTDRSKYHMHNKFGIIDGRITFTGSFNWTRTATSSNQENLLVTSNHTIVEEYVLEFERLWQEMHNY